MTRWSYAAASGDRQGWWMPFAVGLAAGLTGGVLLSRRPVPGAALPSLGRALEGATRRVGAVADTLREGSSIDLDATRERMAAMPGGQGLRLRALTDGILEVVGTAPDAELAGTILEALAREPGVRVVVNRVWTPASASPEPT